MRWWVISVGGRDGEATGQSSEGSAAAGAGSDHRPRSSAVRLAREIDWTFLDSRFASVCTPGAGQPGLPTRLVAGLFILKHMHDLSDEVLCARWLENPPATTARGPMPSPIRGNISAPEADLWRWGNPAPANRQLAGTLPGDGHQPRGSDGLGGASRRGDRPVGA